MTGTGTHRVEKRSHAEKLELLRREMERVAAEGGRPIIDEDAEQLKAPVRARALRLLDQRARSREELRGRLAENEEWQPAVIEQVLDALADAKLLDDAHFASEWVRQRARARGKSRMVLDRELREKGVAAHHRDAALEQVTDADESAVARALAEKKARTIRRPPADRGDRDRDLRRVVGVLARRGFGQGMSMGIAKAALDERYAELGAS